MQNKEKSINKIENNYVDILKEEIEKKNNSNIEHKKNVYTNNYSANISIVNNNNNLREESKFDLSIKNSYIKINDEINIEKPKNKDKEININYDINNCNNNQIKLEKAFLKLDKKNIFIKKEKGEKKSVNIIDKDKFLYYDIEKEKNKEKEEKK